ncbi:ABC transporter permease [Rhizobium sp. KVB221]|uniref:ABC transporter permease n=1 Tax=Rhizobium setariae TaxID=2801340 RepID=A0A937CMX9_9HYPH|nr:ABC transporter permease [Rhizobium setariae]MBL0374855.1 ABC transporter permease [Rhizobium setariae]
MTYVTEIIPPQAPPPAEIKPYSLARFAGSLFMGLWLAAFVATAFFMYEGFSQEKFFKYGPRMISGLGVTLQLVIISIVLGAILSLPIAYARMSNSKILSSLAYGYVYFFRGTPLLAQLYLIYYGIGSFKPFFETVGLWWFFREAFYCALFSFTLNTAAYQAEILRGAIRSVPRGQTEASNALGLHKFAAYWKVILPQAIIVALRPYGNEIILMIKGSAIVAIVTVFDLMGETRYAFSRTFDFQMYLWAAILYLAIVEVLRNVWNALERRLTRHLKR